MDTPSLSSRSPSPHPDLSHSVGEVLRERAGIPEHAPRIKIGDQYYHVVRVVGGHYEAPIAEVESLVKTGAIGESFFSAHKKYAEATPALQGQKILYANDEGVRYENGMLVRNVDVHLDTEDTTNYLKATDNFAWQQEVKDYEQHLNTLAPTDSISRVPPYLHRIATRGRNHGPYTPQQVKGFLLEYTKDKLLAAHEVFVKRHHDPERHREDLERAIDREIGLMQSPTQVINRRKEYFEAYLTTDHLWKMMVDTLQPAEFRLLPEEEALDHTGLPFASSEPIDIPRRSEHHRSSSAELSPHTHSPSTSPLHLPVRPRSASFTHPSQLRSPLPHVPFRPIGSPTELDSHHSSPHVSPRFVREEEEDRGHHSVGSPPILSPTPMRPAQPSLIAQQLEEQRRREESLSPSPTPSRSPSPTHVPPLHLGGSHQSSFHPHHPVAVEVHRTDTLPPATSHIPSRARGQEVHSPSPSLSDGWEEVDLSSRPGSPRPSVVVPFVDPHASQSVGRRSPSPIPRSVLESSSLSGARQRRKAPQWDRTYLDSSDFRRMGDTYRDVEIAAKSATSNDWTDSRESKKLCETALQKFQSDTTGTLTPQELSVVKRIIEIREHSKADRGGFSRLPASERFRAVMNDLERYTAPYAIPLSKG